MDIAKTLVLLRMDMQKHSDGYRKPDPPLFNAEMKEDQYSRPRYEKQIFIMLVIIDRNASSSLTVHNC